MELGDHSTPRPSGSWRTTIAVVAVIIGLIVLLGYSFVNAARASARATACAGNQRMIMCSALIYAADNGRLWPCRPTTAEGAPTINPVAIDGFCTAAASLELLCLSCKGDIPAKCFICPTTAGPYLTYPNTWLTYATGRSHWGSTHDPDSEGGPGRMSYAYDWSAPPDASAVRIMICDRGTLTVGHKMIAMGAAGDGHVVTIPLNAGAHPASAHVTCDEFGGMEGAIGINKDVTYRSFDDVYDDDGDDSAMMTPAGGSSSRCWVR